LQIEFAAAHRRLGSVVFISMTILSRATPCTLECRIDRAGVRA
jgi:hypothetical protein